MLKYISLSALGKVYNKVDSSWLFIGLHYPELYSEITATDFIKFT